MSYTYSTFVTALATLFEYDQTITNAFNANPSSVPAFNTALARAIEYGEDRILRDLDLLNTRVKDLSGALVVNNRTFALPTSVGTFIVLEQIKVILSGNIGQSPMLPVSKEYVENIYPSDIAVTAPSIPTVWAPIDQVSIMVAPPPDIPYSVECFGTQRPTPLSASNASTFISTQLPDLFLSACCVFMAGFQKDFGQQADDPKMAMSWETQYKNQLAPSLIEETRKKLQSVGWSHRFPSPIATPPQT